MNTKYSGIGGFAGSTPSQERLDVGQPVDFVTRLGDVKLETKEPGGVGPVDNDITMERFPHD